jgi:hypothetical protein
MNEESTLLITLILGIVVSAATLHYMTTHHIIK